MKYETKLNCKDFYEKNKTTLIFKRIFDILFSLIGLVLMLVPMIFISLLIKISSPGPILFRQKRVGRLDKDFTIYKFRTMVVNAEKMGMQITVGKDKRITPVGAFLRKTKLDEFPQLLNVLKGDMSFVGPRPEVRKYVDLYNAQERNILCMRPGITDMASIKYRDESSVLEKASDPEYTYIHDIMPEKLRLNFKYMNSISVLTDIKLILETLGKIVRK